MVPIERPGNSERQLEWQNQNRRATNSFLAIWVVVTLGVYLYGWSSVRGQTGALASGSRVTAGVGVDSWSGTASGSQIECQTVQCAVQAKVI